MTMYQSSVVERKEITAKPIEHSRPKCLKSSNFASLVVGIIGLCLMLFIFSAAI